MVQCIPENLLKAYATKKLIPVVGAGVSMSLFHKNGSHLFPSWAGLLKQAAEKLIAENKPKDAAGIKAMIDLENYQLAADIAKKGLTGSLWNQLFKDALDVNFADIDENSLALPQAIWKLSQRIITLNYDKVLRFACPHHHDLRELDNTANGLLANFMRDDIGKPAVWHLHGKIDNLEKIIFTSDRYDKLYVEKDKDYEAALETLRMICSTCNLLFVGCSLDDAELIQQISREHTLFANNTGPHYALVRDADKSAIQAKLKGIPIELICFSEFGAPLISTIDEITNNHITLPPELAPQPKSILPKLKSTKRIAVLTACPIGEKHQYADLLKELRSLKCEISLFPLNCHTLNALENFDYIVILSTLIKKKIIIEGDALEGVSQTFCQLEALIGNNNTQGIFIFLNHNNATALDVDDIASLRLPTLILPALNKQQMSSFSFKFFRKADLSYIEDATVANRDSFVLSELVGESKVVKQRTTLPPLIDAKNTENYVGRRTDLGNLCREVIALQNKNAVLSIKGSGGIGKTITIKKIAVALAERNYFPDGIDFIDCEFISDYAMFEKKVAANFDLENALDIKSQIKASLDRQDKLIILDNLETLLHLSEQQQIKDFIYFICDYASIVITTRETLGLDCELVYELRPFTTDEACELFNQALRQRIPSESEQRFIRQEIVETLLDNNPLAITLVANNIPKSKSFTALRDDLQNDFFRQISDADMDAFDRVGDANIERKKSLYASINFSYLHLDNAQKIAFELLSLFPDGISSKVLQQIALTKKASKRNPTGKAVGVAKASTMTKPLITDGVIKALEDKSVIQVDHGVIKLQSIVGKFAERQWNERSEHERVNAYRNAIDYQLAFAKELSELALEEEYRAYKIFSENQRNFFKSFDYIDATGMEELQLLDYIDNLDGLAMMTPASTPFAQLLSNKWGQEFSADVSLQVCFEVYLLNLQYYGGDFENSFAKLNKLIPINDLQIERSQSKQKNSMLSKAIAIYAMEGEVLMRCQYLIEARYTYSYGYPDSLFQLGVIDHELLVRSKNSFFTLEALHAIGQLESATADKYITSLYPGNHLQLMQAHYVKSKLTISIGKMLDCKHIKKLVSVNPYTLGLQQLMLAMAATEESEKIGLFKLALPNLLHIKYYYVEALLLYATHLQASCLQQEFSYIHQQGLALASHHNYRWLRYQFESLINNLSIPYGPNFYPLPVQVDFDSYVQWRLNKIIKGGKH